MPDLVKGLPPPTKDNPSGFMYDIFCRVGSPPEDYVKGMQQKDLTASEDVIVQIDSDYVIGDNLWLCTSRYLTTTPLRSPREGQPVLRNELPYDASPYFVEKSFVGYRVDTPTSNSMT